MQRLIRSFNTLTDDLREKLQEQYPDGIDNSHIRTIATAKGDSLRVIELRTNDAIYLIKINPESRAEIEEFLDQEDGAAAMGEDLDAGGELETDGADEGADEEEEQMDDDGGEDEGDEEETEEVGEQDEEDED
ncbi:MAG: hypothetical protein JNM31_13460 [Flavobacteriales bacterium]|nr:hypothetical protein [Flavobacteriales bacterium]